MKRTLFAAPCLALLLAMPGTAAALEPVLGQGEDLAVRLDADFNADGKMDLAYVARSEDRRVLVVAIAEGPAESLEIDTTPFGGGSFTLKRGVLAFEDLTGGTTAVASTRRFRFDKQAGRMRLIGLDATLYSRTQQHDGFEVSWNLLNGDLITRELHLNTGGGDAAFDPIVEKKARKRTAPVWLAQSPDPEELISELSAV